MTIPIRTVIDDARVLLGQHPELGRTSTVARAELVGPVNALVRVGRHSFETDEPEVAGGEDTAPSPVQYACGALAACEVVTYRYWSELLGIPFDAVSVEVRADGDIRGFLGFDPAAPPGVSTVTVDTEIRGPLASERYQELHEAVLAHCPVLLAFGGVPVESHLAVVAGR